MVEWLCSRRSSGKSLPQRGTVCHKGQQSAPFLGGSRLLLPLCQPHSASWLLAPGQQHNWDGGGKVLAHPAAASWAIHNLGFKSNDFLLSVLLSVCEQLTQTSYCQVLVSVTSWHNLGCKHCSSNSYVISLV